MHQSPNQAPLLGKSRVIRFRAICGWDCGCNAVGSSQHGSQATSHGRQAERQALRRKEHQAWLVVELDQ